MNKMVQLNSEFLKHIQQNPEIAMAGFKEAVEYIKGSSAIFTRGRLSFMAIPKIFDAVALEHIVNSMKILDSILDKSISQYMIDPEFRRLFEFEAELEELILLESGYSRNLPIARCDIFLNEQTLDFKFCELNADGASAMNEDREIGNAWKNTKLWKTFFQDKQLHRFELFDSWVQSFTELYDEYLDKKGWDKPQKPVLAIVDFLDIGTKSEFEVFRQAFERHGYDAIISDITTLEYDGEYLRDSSGVVVDAIYRRAVTSECMQKLDSIQQFLEGVKHDAVCLIGHFRTQIIHDKNFFRILRLPYTRQLLTDEQNEFVDKHIPYTIRLNSGEFDCDEIVANKDKWLIKPADRYGSQGVATGGDYTTEQFEQLINQYIDNDYVLQEYCTPFKTTNIYFDDDGLPHTHAYNNMTGIFLYNGKVAGLYSRQMTGRVTTKQDEGRVTVSVVCE
ncbi:MAG: hypothetical protein FWF56_02820 [Firmicutes bacterium]|nr:hypothetical protein [Bacillota bacterium]